jgi:hypothetical protein
MVGAAFSDTVVSLLLFFVVTPRQLSKVCCPHALRFLNQFHVLFPTSFVVSPDDGATFFHTCYGSFGLHAVDVLVLDPGFVILGNILLTCAFKAAISMSFFVGVFHFPDSIRYL